ncbi:hypothetical protein ACLOJK_021397 [Asimina triloba]
MTQLCIAARSTGIPPVTWLAIATPHKILSPNMEIGGLDSDGRAFKNAGEMWGEEIGGEEESNKRQEWYTEGVRYWQGVEASVDGVLGGYGHVNEADVKNSEAFLKGLLIERLGVDSPHLVALDCGSGIGRVTRNLLLKFFNEVDLLEPVSHFLEAARDNLSPENFADPDSHKAVNFYCMPLQEFTPEFGRYDVIWIQWCIGQLVDDDFISFFNRAKAGLKPNGLFVIKENIATQGCPPSLCMNAYIHGLLLNSMFYCSLSSYPYCECYGGQGNKTSRTDRSVTRSDLYFKELFSQCGLHIYKMKVYCQILPPGI